MPNPDDRNDDGSDGGGGDAADVTDRASVARAKLNAFTVDKTTVNWGEKATFSWSVSLAPGDAPAPHIALGELSNLSLVGTHTAPLQPPVADETTKTVLLTFALRAVSHQITRLLGTVEVTVLVNARTTTFSGGEIWSAINQVVDQQLQLDARLSRLRRELVLFAPPSARIAMRFSYDTDTFVGDAAIEATITMTFGVVEGTIVLNPTLDVSWSAGFAAAVFSVLLPDLYNLIVGIIASHEIDKQRQAIDEMFGPAINQFVKQTIPGTIIGVKVLPDSAAVLWLAPSGTP